MTIVLAYLVCLGQVLPVQWRLCAMAYCEDGIVSTYSDCPTEAAEMGKSANSDSCCGHVIETVAADDDASCCETIDQDNQTTVPTHTSADVEPTMQSSSAWLQQQLTNDLFQTVIPHGRDFVEPDRLPARLLSLSSVQLLI